MTLRLVNQPPSDPDVVNDRSYQRLAAQIFALIDAGEFKPGERLPSERALAERFDVSRTSVREAIIALEVQGAVEVRGGSGIYVSQPAPASVKPRGVHARGRPRTVRTASRALPHRVGNCVGGRRDAKGLRPRSHLLGAGRHARAHGRQGQPTKRPTGCSTFASPSRQATACCCRWSPRCGTTPKGPVWAKIDEHFHTTELRLASQEDHQRVFNALLNARCRRGQGSDARPPRARDRRVHPGLALTAQPPSMPP